MELVLGLVCMVGSIVVMIARRSAFGPYLAMGTGAIGIFFFSNLPNFALIGIAISSLAIVLGGALAIARRRVAKKQQQVKSELSGFAEKAYLSDSGHWRVRTL